MSPRGVGRVISCEQVSDDTFKLRIFGRGNVTNAAYVTSCGDFDIVSINDLINPHDSDIFGVTSQDTVNFTADMSQQLQKEAKLEELPYNFRNDVLVD